MHQDLMWICWNREGEGTYADMLMDYGAGLKTSFKTTTEMTFDCVKHKVGMILLNPPGAVLD